MSEVKWMVVPADYGLNRSKQHLFEKDTHYKGSYRPLCGCFYAVSKVVKPTESDEKCKMCLKIERKKNNE